MIDFTQRASFIWRILDIRPDPDDPPHIRNYLEAEQLRLLARIEEGMAATLEMMGLSREAAATSACSFVRQCVERFREREHISL